MRAGRLRCKAVIQQNSAGQDAIGGRTESWSTLYAGWYCELHQVKGGESFRGRVVHASADTVAIGRYVAGVTPRHRLTYDGSTYDIVAANNVDRRNRELRLDLRSRGL